MESNEKIGVRVSINTIIGNVILAFVKILVAFIANSHAMMADGFHSMPDVITTVGVIVGLKLSNRPEDVEHPYGHERIESITSLFLSIVLLGVALGIGYSGIKNIVNGTVNVPGSMAIAAAILSIAVKEWMYFYTIKYAKQLNSASLKADAWHHRSDSLSSIGALAGIIAARLGFPAMDSVVAIVISVIIIKVAIDVLKESINQLIDTSAGNELNNIIETRIKNIDGIRRIDLIRTRQHASKIYVDVEVSVDASISVEEGHNIAMMIHHSVEEEKNVKHCMVHVNPYN